MLDAFWTVFESTRGRIHFVTSTFNFPAPMYFGAAFGPRTEHVGRAVDSRDEDRGVPDRPTKASFHLHRYQMPTVLLCLQNSDQNLVASNHADLLVGHSRRTMARGDHAMHPPSVVQEMVARIKGHLHNGLDMVVKETARSSLPVSPSRTTRILLLLASRARRRVSFAWLGGGRGGVGLFSPRARSSDRGLFSIISNAYLGSTYRSTYSSGTYHSDIYSGCATLSNEHQCSPTCVSPDELRMDQPQPTTYPPTPT